MTLRAIVSPPWRSRSSLRAWTLGSALVLALAGTFGALPASATVQSIEVVPSSPTSCDSVALLVKGVMPSPCHALISATLEQVFLRTMSPLPTYGVGIKIVVQEPNPALDIACPTVLQPYERKLYLPHHPSGAYQAHATEYLVPYTPDSSGVPKDSSVVETPFTVAPDSTCPKRDCYRIDFGKEGHGSALCDGAGPPGGTACVDVSLMTLEPVAGLQSVIQVSDPRLDQTLPLPGSILRPISVEAIGGAEGAQVQWDADGSTVRFILYTADGKRLPYLGAILRVCYAIGSEAVPGAYILSFGETVVSDPLSRAIPRCPRIDLEWQVGRLCVGDGGCDLDGNGVSNILDIIRLVRCALGGPDSAAFCPDTTMAHADCNEDGSVDVRDVICCIRNILLLAKWGLVDFTTDPGNDHTRIRFLGPAEYWKPGSANAQIELDPGPDFGGAAVEIEAPPGTRITSISDQNEPNPVYGFLSEVGDGRRSRFLIVRNGNQGLTEPIRAWVSIRTVGPLPQGAALHIVGAEGGLWSQVAPAPSEITQGLAAVRPYAVPAPRVYPARPNPFTSATDLYYELDSQRHLTVRIFSASGKLVRTLIDATTPRGINRLSWNGRDESGREVSSGIYFVRFSIPEAQSTIRIMRLK